MNSSPASLAHQEAGQELRVLFVDDEPRVLEGLVRTLFDLDWDVSIAHSGREALELLSRHPVDVVISDMRMPGMDGAELLRQVKERFPEAVRVILSGHTEAEAALRAVPVAHQFLSKPCDRDTLTRVVERAQSLIALMRDEHLRGLIGRIASLPAVPATYVELREVLARSDSSIVDVARVVERDMALTAKVLQLVNSSFFSTATTATSVQQAVTRLGGDMMQSLALAAHVFDAGAADDPELAAFLQAGQQDALRVATAAKSLCADPLQADLAFLSGVVHDIGQVVLRVGDPEGVRCVAQKMTEDGMPWHEAERAVFGATHAEVGAYLIGIWGLPPVVVGAILHHHDARYAPGHDTEAVATAIYLANALVTGEAEWTQALSDFDLSARREEFEARFRRLGILD